MFTQEELTRQKEKVESLSEKAEESYKTLMRLCNEISFAKDLDSVGNNSPEADNLTYLLGERIIHHLNNTQFLLSAYEEYSEMLEKLIHKVKPGGEEG